MNKRAIGIALVLCTLLVLTITPEVKALSYSDTEFDFQSFTNDSDSIGTITYGLLQDGEDDLDGTDGWTKDTNGICTRSSSDVYEGSYSANVSSTSGVSGVEKEFSFATSEDFNDLWLSCWVSGNANDADNDGYTYIRLYFKDSLVSPTFEWYIDYVLANSTTFDATFENNTYGPGFIIFDPITESETTHNPRKQVENTWNCAIRIGDCNATGVYIHRDVTSDLESCYSGGNGFVDWNANNRVGYLNIELKASANYILNVDVLLASTHTTITPLPEPTITGTAKSFYNESGLCFETGSGESAYARIDYDDFGDKWDYGIKVTYGGTGTSTNISSLLNVDAGGWSDWNHTIATLGNDTFMYYTTNQSYVGEDIAGRYVDIDCPASSSIIIQSLTFREGYPSGGGGIDGGGGGGIAPETVATEVVSELTTTLIFGIQYWHLLLVGIGTVVLGHKFTKKKIHYRLPKQSLMYVSVISGFLLVFFWITLSIFYMEAPPESYVELPLLFYIIGLVVPLILVPVSKSIKMQGVERAPNKFVFQSKDFMPSIVKGIILLTSASFVIYYILNFTMGFRADTFLVTQIPQELVAFQLGSTTTLFLHFILPFIEESVFRFWVPQMIAAYTDETQRAIISAGMFGAFHYYVAKTIGMAFFVYFFVGGVLFYSICYGTIWLEKYWKGMPSVLKFKGAGIFAAIIVHLLFNFMALYGGSLLQTAWVVEI